VPEENEGPGRFARVKQHVKDHKVAYIAGATGVSCLVIGGAAGLALGRADVRQLVDSVKLIHIQYKSPNVNIALVKQACMDPIPILDKLTGEAYASINRAARATGETVRSVSLDAQGAASRFERLPETVFA